MVDSFLLVFMSIKSWTLIEILSRNTYVLYISYITSTEIASVPVKSFPLFILLGKNQNFISVL